MLIFIIVGVLMMDIDSGSVKAEGPSEVVPFFCTKFKQD